MLCHHSMTVSAIVLEIYTISIQFSINISHTSAIEWYKDNNYIISDAPLATNDDDDLELDLPLCAAKARAEGIQTLYF